MNFWRQWGWPLSLGTLSGLIIIAGLYEPAQKADLTVSASLCGSLRENGWSVAPSGQLCLVTAKYRRIGNPFLRIEQNGRSMHVNTAEVLAIRVTG